MYIRAESPRALAAYLHGIDRMRHELAAGLRSKEEIDRELRHGRDGVTLERAARAYADRPGIAGNTRRAVRSLVAEHLSELGPLPLVGLDAPRVARWVDKLAREGLAASTIRHHWRMLSAIVAHATERGWIGAVPWGSYKPKRLGGPGREKGEAARTPAEFMRLARAARDLDRENYTGLWAKIMAAGLLGLRQGELAGLRWSDVAWGPPIVIAIARQWVNARTKTKRAVRLESIGELALALRSHESAMIARELYAPRGPVFPGPDSEPGRPRPYTRGEVITRLLLRSAVERAGLPSVGHLGAWSAHGLRATFCTLETGAAGGDLALVQARSRHASLASLSRYVRAQRNVPAPPLFRFPRDDDDAGIPLLSLSPK